MDFGLKTRDIYREGREEGELIGFEKGESLGLEKGRREIAQKMKAANADLDFIAKVTGLSIKEIEALTDMPMASAIHQNIK